MKDDVFFCLITMIKLKTFVPVGILHYQDKVKRIKILIGQDIYSVAQSENVTLTCWFNRNLTA